ncbi:hypothetical protein D5F51_19830 [Yersinia hibernica]|uniref:Uncharacterized protein n=1 Tax=Yersinia hibernica TaxID=2339259 RepID=A0ABX5R538_9GAMM|nr:hypothetical protein D5F51_19830 [Yersinia hibernica]
MASSEVWKRLQITQRDGRNNIFYRLIISKRQIMPPDHGEVCRGPQPQPRDMQLAVSSPSFF